MDLIESKKRSRRLNTICILAIVLGAMGLMSIFASVVGMAMQHRSMQFMPRVRNSKAIDLNNRMQSEIQAVSKRYAVYQIPVLILWIPVCVALIVGGAKMLRQQGDGLKVLRAALLAAIPVELARGVIGIYMSREVSAITSERLKEIMEIGSGSGHPTLFPDVFTGFVRTISSIGFVLGFAWVLAKVWYYIFSVRYLNNPAVRSMLQPKPRPVPPPFPPPPAN